MKPTRVIILDIDGLRPDVFRRTIEEKRSPNLLRFVMNGENDCALHVDATSVSPSITFCAQASIFTGEHPRVHRIPGNDFFDRIGALEDGQPRHVGFDVGDTLSVDDAVSVFRNAYADRLLSSDARTIYESAAQAGKESLVMHNMYFRGARTKHHPALFNLFRFFKGFSFLKLTPQRFDHIMLDSFEKILSRLDTVPELFTLYFMGMDSHSHHYGPSTQADYFHNHLDGHLGRLWDTLSSANLIDGTMFVFISDHGQSYTPGDDAHTIRLGFPFDMELSPLFHALDLDLHDIPGEDPNVDAVVGQNGGMAHVYLRHKEGDWERPPRFENDVLRVARAFHELNTEGKYRAELQNTLDTILIRNAEQDGWGADYFVYQPGDVLQPFEEWVEQHPELNYVDPVNRVRNMQSDMSGDLLLLAQAKRGVYFGKEGHCGIHGSLQAEDSMSTLAFSMPTATPAECDTMRQGITSTIQHRCQQENQRHAAILDMAHSLRTWWLG